MRARLDFVIPILFTSSHLPQPSYPGTHHHHHSLPAIFSLVVSLLPPALYPPRRSVDRPVRLQLRRHMQMLGHPMVGDKRYPGHAVTPPTRARPRAQLRPHVPASIRSSLPCLCVPWRRWTKVALNAGTRDCIAAPRPLRSPAGIRAAAGRQAVDDCGLMLWAADLELTHPLDGRPLRFSAPPPPKFAAFLAREADRWAKFNAAGGGGDAAGRAAAPATAGAGGPDDVTRQ